MITLQELADRCGVSRAAASKAMNHQKGISKEKAELVRRTAAEFGYMPNAAARTLRTDRSRNIGIIFSNELAHEYFSLVFASIRENLEKMQYDITFLSGSVNGGYGYYEHAKNRQCDGVIIAQEGLDSEDIKRLVESELPVISIDQVYPGRTAVVNDNEESMIKVVRYVNQMGHRRIAFIHGEVGDVTLQRIEGFKKGCRECGIDAADGLILEAKYHEPKESGLATRKLLDTDRPPTVILYPDDVSILGGMTEITSRGLRIPEDISCFGYDGIRMANLYRPRLSTYQQNAFEIGRTAVFELIRMIEEPEQKKTSVITIPGTILEGETVSRRN